MKLQQVHALRACSLVAIPPSEERMPPPGGFPKDLSCMNLTSWAGLIQDVAQGIKVVPPNLSMEICLEAMVLLQLLEATTGMGYCRTCSQPSPWCHCEDDQYAPTATWSQMMARMQGQGGAASIGGPTPPGTTTAGVQEQGVFLPLPGLQPPDFSKWSLPLPEAPVTGGLSMPSEVLPSIGDRTASPWASGQKARHYQCRHQALPRECCQFVSWDYPSLLHLPSRQHSHRADLLLPKSGQCSCRASLLHHTNRPCSCPGGQQEGDCWLNLLQMEPLLLLTLPTRTGEGNKLGDGASEADRPVAPEGDEG